jgi:hypothetical protein
MTVFGGRDGTDTADMNDLWVLSNVNAAGSTGVWSLLIANGAAGSPPVRWGASAVYDAGSNRMILFGGCNGGCLPTLNDVWVLANANGLGGTPAWIHLSPTGIAPTPRTRHTAIYDASNNRMIIFAGQNGSGNGCATFSDLWMLSNANGLGGTPAWTQLSTAGGPPLGQYSATATYDSTNNRMIVFGGAATIGTACSFSNAVWILTNANGLGGVSVWTNLIPEGAAGSPVGRGFHTAVYNALSNHMIIFAGDSNDVNLNDSWFLSNANGLGGVPSWSQLTPSNSPPTRSGHLATFNPASNTMIIFGGIVSTGDTWELSNVP